MRFVAVGLALLVASSANSESFIAGADFSHLAFFESEGIVYRNGGQVLDGLQILSRNGLTCVRLRLFTSSAAQAQADPYNYTNNLNYTVPLAVRVKSAGLQFLLDFHYSDTWADPGHQAKPAAWTSLSFAQLVLQMRNYNSNCIAAFKAAGALPDYVQVGNEITSGLLWPDGEVGGAYDTPTQWSNLAQLLNAAVQGIRDAAGAQMPKIIIHIDRGGDWNTTKWFFDSLPAVSFDVIGESYYPFWHGPLANLANCLTNAAARYGKPVLVAETDFPWSNSTNVYSIPATPDGQVQYATALAQVVNGVPHRLGLGIFWWGTEYQHVAGVNTAGFEYRSFFDSSGNVLPIAGAFGQMVAPLNLGADLGGGSLALTWPLSGAGFSLLTSTNVAIASVWSAVTNSVQTIGTTFSVTVPVDLTHNHYYRLQSP